MTSAPRTPLRDLQGALPATVDLFICSASYESRSVAAPLSLPTGTPARVLVCANEDVQGAGKDHASQIMEHFAEHAAQVVLSKTNPVIGADALLEHIRRVASGRTSVQCVVDITTFTHEGLLILLRVLQYSLPKGSDVTFIYTPARDYDPGTPPEQKWLSKGLGGVRSVLGYPGSLLPSRKIHLIVLVGFESDRAKRLIESYEPDALSLGVGCVSPLNSSLEDVRKVFYQELTDAFPHYTNFEFSPSDPYSVRDVLLEHIGSYPKHNIVLAPMNTKISTIGAAMAAFERDEVQLTYGSAGMYNFYNYSIPEDNCIIFRTPSFPI